MNNPSNKSLDLADLLGTNWPSHVGAVAAILNRDQSGTKQNDGVNSLNISPGVTVNQESMHDTNLVGEDAYEIPGTSLTVGSLVEVADSELSDELYGVIRWIGLPSQSSNNLLIGIELEDDVVNLKHLSTSNGSYNGIRLFECNEGRALFVPPSKCSIDRRFIDIDSSPSGNKITNDSQSITFGIMDCPYVLGSVPPLKVCNSEELNNICGKFKGIQGHHNSCYLDATLFSMFTFTSVFDSILYRCSGPQDIAHYSSVQKVLRDEIVNPLRKNLYVRADRVMQLRKLLDQLSSVSGLTSEEKDPEEFLNSLLAQIMRVEPFLKLSSGQDSYFYQLFVEKDERLTFPTVQQLFEQSFHSSSIKLKEVPSCLIIQMPRFGKNYKMYPRILPSQVLDVTDIIEDSPRQCSVCGKLAEHECGQCYGSLQSGSGLECTAFCQKCLETVHLHSKRTTHVTKKIFAPRDYKIMADHIVIPRLYMELFAVVCIETSHYVSFVKAGSGPDAPWCFFDSMADRKDYEVVSRVIPAN
ncbi:ubiquitin carboxyl-terminal hydrolase CYLD isoform X2 [Drosophila willistoni]|uniref:ubiquitin carboxyl-terminal hydrolase CYLD isoform X2 n=1 Tax=Drosophila willistoni TaxID=7260 RepID=UPI001F07435E|nr:ubiquitin carboxyl-terminal hydrolase CYLD isoform X2 [Drosophila willistoni]